MTNQWASSPSDEHRYMLAAALLGCSGLAGHMAHEDLLTLISDGPRRSVETLKPISALDLLQLLPLAKLSYADLIFMLLKEVCTGWQRLSSVMPIRDEMTVRSLIPIDFMRALTDVKECPAPAAADSALGDSHLHSGGLSSPLEVISHLLPHVHELVQPDQPMTVQDSAGKSITVDALLLGVAFTCLLLEQPLVIKSSLVQAIFEYEHVDNFWTSAMQLARQYDAERFLSLQRCLSAMADVVVTRPNLPRLTDRIKGYIRGETVCQSGVLAQAAHALVIVHVGISVNFPSTLDDFVTSFGLLGQLRKRYVDDEQQRLSMAVKRLVSRDRVVRFELRKNISLVGLGECSESRDVETDLITDIQSHASAFSAVRRARPDIEFRGAMPVTFKRGVMCRDFEPQPGWSGLLYPVHEYLASAEGLAEAWHTHPASVIFIGALDVVGREAATPNWVFSLVFSRVAELCEELVVDCPVFSVHAGEQFSNPLNGLRRVGELQDYGVPVSRIGHALALGTWPESKFDADASSAIDALFDLVWLGSVLEPSPQDVRALALDIAELVVAAPSMFAWEDLVNWRRGLFQLDHLRRIGLVPVMVPLAESFFAGGQVSLRLLSLDSVADRLIAATILAATVDGWYVRGNTPLGADLRNRYRDIGKVYVSQAREFILGGLDGVILEACPTSNLLLGGVDGYSGHPLWDWAGRGINVSISTDDPGVFGTSAWEELGRLRKSSDIADDVDSIVDRLQAASFSAACPWLETVDFDNLIAACLRV